MDNSAIVQAIDLQISQLQQARALLANEGPAKKSPGRPKKAAAVSVKKTSTPKKRTMSAEGKARIAAAQKLRWAKQHAKKSAGAKKRS